jgi:hypothetical protein
MLAEIARPNRSDCKAFAEKRGDYGFNGAVEAVIHDKPPVVGIHRNLLFFKPTVDNQQAVAEDHR